MSYQVLARKWRPRKFAEMVGQEHVLRALVNALDQDRLHHAYLFTGTRGVGKTTVARIFAKSLNCESGVSAEPCGQCAACTEIDQGRFVDLIEVDAASRTKVEDTRELLDNVQYAPTRGRYKVYLVDEVHMLSTHSFNALLKTLEEPPPHVKFLLATTDPQKLPATVLSRCLQFNLKRLEPALIRGHLARLLEAESIAFEEGALRLLARAADGSMRDALSLLDQAIAFGDGHVNEAEVRSMLGTIEHGQVMQILRALAEGDAAALLDVVAGLAERAPDYEGLLAELLGELQQIAVAQAAPDALDAEHEQREQILGLAQQLAPEDVQLYYQIGLIGRRDLPLSPEPRAGLEMILLRMLAFRPELTGQATGRSEAKGGPVAREPAASARAETAPAPASSAGGQASPAGEGTDAAGGAQAALSTDLDWSRLVEAMSLRGMARELAMNCALESRGSEQWRLTLAADCRQLLSESRRSQIEKALGDCLGQRLRLSIEVCEAGVETPAARRQREAEQRQARAVEAIDSDPNIRAFRETFGATLHDESIRPLDLDS
ncbi:MAG TPA: DNA polymerase III subunit gamma/tau [Gammaproteobacteria bacterium]|nr:DNA polymerase III subunit gamma/tau [Gammaproteobacteria bacterium]